MTGNYLTRGFAIAAVCFSSYTAASATPSCGNAGGITIASLANTMLGMTARMKVSRVAHLFRKSPTSLVGSSCLFSVNDCEGNGLSCKHIMFGKPLAPPITNVSAMFFFPYRS